MERKKYLDGDFNFVSFSEYVKEFIRNKCKGKGKPKPKGYSNKIIMTSNMVWDESRLGKY